MKSIVIYFSRKGMNYVNGEIMELKKGNAQRIAEIIAEAVHADTFEVVRRQPYAQDYRECVKESVQELQENARPQLEQYVKDISEYAMVYVVGPCWCGHYPMPLASQLGKLDFHGKKVAFVMSHEGSGLAQGRQDIQSWCKGAIIADGLAIKGTTVEKEKERIAGWARKAEE